MTTDLTQCANNYLICYGYCSISSYISKVSLSVTPRTSVQVGPAVFDSPTGITAYRRRELTNGFEAVSSCSIRNGDCEEICLATPDGPQCACQEGLITGKTCSSTIQTYKCPQVHSGRKGEIRSPGYPGYTNNVYCMITIHVDNPDKKEHIIRLYVEDFDLQDKHDYLVIGNNRHSGLSNIQVHNSYEVRTDSEDTKWLFVTDGSVTARGFHFKYDIFQVVQCGSQACLNGGTCVENKYCECLDGYEGVLCGEGQLLKLEDTPNFILELGECQYMLIESLQWKTYNDKSLLRCITLHSKTTHF
ncbi:hypothetical protein NP493_1573g00009 [Ridgeia piscesae]|uniref:Uncharacterized protein n=1 Tax=Ridgeia piscesae TaxID=27915 RepID=A0AAD9JZG7_RIDPI|nr:hypothetical protein NP493_1573g00009 [Ridgeia piscesae]